MRVLLFSGSHARHVYVHEQLIESDALDVCGIVSMQREPCVPDPPDDCSDHDRALFEHHFERREKVERQAYGDRSADRYESAAPTLFVDRDELNSERVASFVRDVDADAAFIFGTGLILDPVLGHLPEWRLNFHLGLSPRYKGSATLFWPFYFLEPQYAGGTLHQIIEDADAGAIVHQTRPALQRGDGVHETAAAVVEQFAEETVALFEHLAVHGSLPLTEQTETGKLFRSDDFHPHHLGTIYDLYDNDIVDHYLDGNLGDHEPTLVNAFDAIETERP
ncbi:formyltransferase family protein [Haloarculaceae archaeon H-GB2-1]|nr:formyltransferase family protein [Haloarculaceae archaeon H-GB1-1]MEA5388449.1 formyltransferase family protein [Haloarculaceae archaeon H-GB11]MEA5406487.1 formyltransferase family protein [Haloarculaceae archaeon H-GB2-1]